MEIFDRIRKHQNSGGKLIIYCAGLHGVEFYRILKFCGICVDYFSDSDTNKHNHIIIDSVKCIAPEELRKETCLGFICVWKSSYKDVYEYVQSKELFVVLEINSVIDEMITNNRELFFEVVKYHATQRAADVFYDLTPNSQFIQKTDKISDRKKTAVYTAVFGGYDNIDPGFSQYHESDIDFFYISDIKPEDIPEGVKWVDARSIIPDEIKSPIKRNRFIKMHPHLLFEDYEWSIYLDGNVELMRVPFELLIDSKTGITAFAHPARECIYYEALSICNFKRVSVDDVCCQMNRYMEEGMPTRYGLMEMPVLARAHNKKECITVMETWWKEFDNEAQRDQLSFMYALWKNEYSANDLTVIQGGVRNYDAFGFHNHVEESKGIVNTKGKQTIGIQG